jgi:hypothetical protein
MWMWGDRLIDAETHLVGAHEASANHTHPAVDMLSKDIIVCDWHYERVPATLEYFLEKGFRVVACPWRIEAVALHQLVAVHRLRRETDRALGVMQTTWCEFGDFVRAYHGEGENVGAAEAARCFKTLFAAIREGDERLAVAEKAQREPTEAPSLGPDPAGELIAQGRYRVVLGGSKAGSEDFQIARTDDGYHLRAHGVPPSGLEAPFEMALKTDRSFAACAAELQERVAVPLRARYHLADGKARAEAALGGLAIPAQTIDASEGALLVGPSYAGWAWVIRAADLRVGQSAQVPIVLFGLGSWQMIQLPCTLSREDDMPVTLGDGSRVESRHYRLRIATPMRELPGEAWTDDEGVVLRLQVVTSVGPVEVELESLLRPAT